MNNNDEIINNIKEIYQNAPANKIHQLIAKHFIPSIEEKKNNAEIPTPILLVEEMLDKMPNEFWKEKNKVFEPCCGKGNFVMKIFEKFFNGLSEKYPNAKKRCKKIITKCSRLKFYKTRTCLLWCHFRWYTHTSSCFEHCV